MMRLFVLVLLIANGVYFVWTNGALRAYGLAPQQQSEPQHLTQQIQPNAVRILSPQEIARIEEQNRAEQMRAACQQAGPFEESKKQALDKQLPTLLTAGSWQWQTQQISERWIVYMGRYASQDILAKKRSELSALNLPSELVNDPASLAPGFSLGAFDTKAAADTALAQLNARGVHTARVVKQRAESRLYQLTLNPVDESQKFRLSELKPMLDGKALHGCALTTPQTAP